MDNVFTLGISSLWDEVCHMPVGGVWWLNVDRYADAVSLFNQTLAAQAKNSHVAALVMGNKPKDIISLDHTHGPDNIALFTLPNRPQALEEIHRDLVCSLEPGNYLFILLCAENAWQNINNEKLCAWVEKTSRWAQYHRCAFLAINSAQDIDRQLTPLLREYRSLSGLASIRYQGDRHIFDIAWWGSDKGISAQQQLMVQHDDAGWRLAQDAETSVQPRSDEKAILSHVRVLEGAPPLSEYWTLFDTNDEVFNAGRTAQAATILFSITQNTQIEQLGRYIHTLRRQPGDPQQRIALPLPDANRKRTEPKVLPPYPGRFCHPADLEPAVKAARLPEVGCLLRSGAQRDDQYPASTRQQRRDGGPAPGAGAAR